MNWVIIGFILLSIVGSMMWMMPSPHQRAQAIFRQKAMRVGMQVQMTRLLFPRAIGEAIPDELPCIAYRLGRQLADRRNKKPTIPWHIFKVNGHATTGLPEGWCWSKGEGYLDDRELALIAGIIEKLPEDGYSLESTPIATSVYWRERGTLETIDEIHDQLKYMIDKNI